MKFTIHLFLFTFLFSSILGQQYPIWHGLKVEEESRCSPYKRKRDYSYSPSIERKIVTAMNNKIYCPYSGKFFKSIKETDIEHIVSLSEAHDSGLCQASPWVRKEFASDMRNLALTDPSINRYQKRGFDAGEWMPANNKCWYVRKIIEVKKAYNLSVDSEELMALQRTLSRCNYSHSTPMEGEERIFSS